MLHFTDVKLLKGCVLQSIAAPCYLLPALKDIPNAFPE
jgi:hypothetical protein